MSRDLSLNHSHTYKLKKNKGHINPARKLVGRSTRIIKATSKDGPGHLLGSFFKPIRTFSDLPRDLDMPSLVYNMLSKLMHRVPLAPSSRRYNLTLCHEKRFLWFRVAKTGTRTILHLLKKNGIHLDAEHPMNVHYPINLYRDYFKFAFVRNPWDRLVSCWHNKIVDTNWWGLPETDLTRLRDFGNFVDFVSKMDLEACDVHLRLQCSVIDLNRIDYLGRFENFETDLHNMFKKLKLSIAKITKRNASMNRSDYRDYYDDTLVEKVRHIYRKDIQIFHYHFQGYTPYKTNPSDLCSRPYETELFLNQEVIEKQR